MLYRNAGFEMGVGLRWLYRSVSTLKVLRLDISDVVREKLCHL